MDLRLNLSWESRNLERETSEYDKKVCVANT